MNGWTPLWRPPIGGPDQSADLAQQLTHTVASGLLRDSVHTGRLEMELAGFFARRAIAVGSGMDALELVLDTLREPGREVHVPAHAFQAIPALAARLGFTPVPMDVDPNTLAPAVAAAEKVPSSGIVIWIHHGGIVADYAETTIAALWQRGVTVIEDCAYVLPTDPSGPGTWGDASTWSFAPTKPISSTAGGAVVTANTALAQEIRDRRKHSGVEHLWELGDTLLRNRTLSETDALLATYQFRTRTTTAAALARVADAYATTLLAERPDLLPVGRRPQSTWSRFCVDLGDGHDALDTQAALAREQIGTAVMFARPWTDYPALAPYETGSLPGLRALLRRTLCLPFHTGLSRDDTARVTKVLLGILSEGASS
ncbi:DegT/DnrJ/EryC1/StrS family aminotransferase [Streptomyces filamentosus]|uniref:DegT/DnrJ/EryC1/StrS family aminotransferase n=1 Tax=Streptomyces filamentosus TaxID=67294 RepID=UPI0033C8AB71